MDSQSTQRPEPYRSVRVRPEILPPEDHANLPPAHDREVLDPSYGEPSYGGPAPRRRRSRWAYAPATYVLLAINILVFLPMAWRNDIRLLVFDYGANYGVGEINGNEWWRVLTATFIHDGTIHIASNMWCLWNLGLLGEPLLGSWGLLATYLVTGIAGNLLGSAVHPAIGGVGASGAVFGLAGVLIMLLKSPLLPVPPEELKRLRRSVIWFALLNFAIGGGMYVAGNWIHFDKQIDNMAHLGGFLSGLALGLPLLPRIGAPRTQFLRRQWSAFLAAGFLLILAAYWIYKFRYPILNS